MKVKARGFEGTLMSLDLVKEIPIAGADVKFYDVKMRLDDIGVLSVSNVIDSDIDIQTGGNT